MYSPYFVLGNTFLIESWVSFSIITFKTIVSYFVSLKEEVPLNSVEKGK